MEHLFSSSHQQNSSSRIWALPEKRKQRTLVISNLQPRFTIDSEPESSDKTEENGNKTVEKMDTSTLTEEDISPDCNDFALGPYERQFAWYFGQFSLICDFYFDRNENVCIVEVDSK